MAFMTLEVILFPKKSKHFFTFALFSFFVYLLPRLNNERPHTTLLVLEKAAMKHVFRAKIWLYGFDSVFWQVLIEFLFVFFLFFLAAKKPK